MVGGVRLGPGVWICRYRDENKKKVKKRNL
jgi:hypothetical protein